jgi:hypothetical protein
MKKAISTFSSMFKRIDGRITNATTPAFVLLSINVSKGLELMTGNYTLTKFSILDVAGNNCISIASEFHVKTTGFKEVCTEF